MLTVIFRHFSAGVSWQPIEKPHNSSTTCQAGRGSLTKYQIARCCPSLLPRNIDKQYFSWLTYYLGPYWGISPPWRTTHIYIVVRKHVTNLSFSIFPRPSPGGVGCLQFVINFPSHQFSVNCQASVLIITCCWTGLSPYQSTVRQRALISSQWSVTPLRQLSSLVLWYLCHKYQACHHYWAGGSRVLIELTVKWSGEVRCVKCGVSLHCQCRHYQCN